MPSTHKPDLREMNTQEVQKMLLGFISNIDIESHKVSKEIRERLDATLAILHELNAQINYTNAMSIMLGAKNVAPATLKSRLIALNSELIYQNEVLTKLEKTLQKPLFLVNTPVAENQKETAASMLDVLNRTIELLQNENKHLLEQARELRQGKKQPVIEPEPRSRPRSKL